ncbi:MAG TPA: carbohydrate ABC transporter substrate-binding protein, partial [Spirochaetia bacterium]|nr:carbohydrate ABC transporter substrate-binding protein [Spirochaetia bacterium]
MKKIFGVGLALLLILAVPVVLFAQKTEFTIFHYWTAGGEKEAIDELFKIFQQQHPNVKILENPV